MSETGVFDIHQHQNEQLRLARRRVQALEAERDQLVRILAQILAALFQDTYVDPYEYLQTLVDNDNTLRALR